MNLFSVVWLVNKSMNLDIWLTSFMIKNSFLSFIYWLYRTTYHKSCQTKQTCAILEKMPLSPFLYRHLMSLSQALFPLQNTLQHGLILNAINITDIWISLKILREIEHLLNVSKCSIFLNVFKGYLLQKLKME